MTLKATMEETFAAVHFDTDAFAETVDYTSVAGGNDEIVMILVRDGDGNDYETEGENRIRRARGTIPLSDIADPRKGDLVTDAAGTVWTLDRITSKGFGECNADFISELRVRNGAIRKK